MEKTGPLALTGGSTWPRWEPSSAIADGVDDGDGDDDDDGDDDECGADGSSEVNVLFNNSLQQSLDITRLQFTRLVTASVLNIPTYEELSCFQAMKDTGGWMDVHYGP